MEKTLFILHYSPPVHGASKVGDSILESQVIKKHLNAEFIKIKSSDSIGAIGKFNFKKISYFIELLLKVIWKLLFFRPQIIYFTTSSFGFAFYRDLVLSIPIKFYCGFKKCTVFYHYHAKGIASFVKDSKRSYLLTTFFVKNVNLIFISEIMQSEVSVLKGYKKVYYLKNGVEDVLGDSVFNDVLKAREDSQDINVLYLSNMILDKGYDTALELANKLNKQSETRVNFHFAGGWSSIKDEQFFNTYVKEHQLENSVTYYGLVQGEAKKELFSKAHIFLFPSRYKKEVFPLSILEALSYGLPVLAFNAGAISEIINTKIGLITNKDRIFESYKTIEQQYLNKKTYETCRSTFVNYYTVRVFEENLLAILKSHHI